jgi:hypothetical protein
MLQGTVQGASGEKLSSFPNFRSLLDEGRTGMVEDGCEPIPLAIAHFSPLSSVNIA